MIVLFKSASGGDGGCCSGTNCSSSCGLSVNESLLELFAVDVAVLAFPPVLSVIPPPPFGVIAADGSGDFDRPDGPS